MVKKFAKNALFSVPFILLSYWQIFSFLIANIYKIQITWNNEYGKVSTVCQYIS